MLDLAERSVEANKRIEEEGLVDFGSYIHENGNNYELCFYAYRMETKEEMLDRQTTEDRLREDAIKYYENKLKELRGA